MKFNMHGILSFKFESLIDMLFLSHELICIVFFVLVPFSVYSVNFCLRLLLLGFPIQFNNSNVCQAHGLNQGNLHQHA